MKKNGIKHKLIWKPFGILTLAALALLTGCGGKSSKKVDTLFFPTPPQNPKIQFLTRYRTSRDLGKKVSGFKKFITGQEENIELLKKPHDAVYYQGRLYIADTHRGEVVVMDLKKKEIKTIGSDKFAVLEKPLSIAISDDGLKYVADNSKKQIFVYDKNDNFVKTFGVENQFSPTSLAVYNEKLYVADVKDREIEVLDRITGEVLNTTNGSADSDTARFQMPTYLTVDSKGNLYVSDMLASRVQIFDSTLTFIRNIGYPGDTYGAFARPRGVAVDSAGYIYVVDAAFENVQIFSQQGELLLHFGGSGTFPGAMYLPAGINISYSNLDIFSQYVDKRFEIKYAIIVANQYGPNGISIYAFGNGKEGYFEKVITPTGFLKHENKQ